MSPEQFQQILSDFGNSQQNLGAAKYAAATAEEKLKTAFFTLFPPPTDEPNVTDSTNTTSESNDARPSNGGDSISKPDAVS